MTILDHYGKEKQRFLENCVQCGLCAQGCPIIPHTDIGEDPSGDIQTAIFNFMDRGIPDQQAYSKAFACMECFKCMAGMCPEDLNPMLINELIKGDYISKGLASSAFSDANQPDSTHRVMASVQVSAAEYNRITTPSGKKKARTVFFPGCNVYFQPEKILNALDIMDAIGDDYAFLPGLEYCCGDNYLFFGDVKEGSNRAEELVAAVAGFDPEAVVLWCPTCQCRFDKYISPSMDVPFEILSLPQYLAENMNKLPLTRATAGTVTLHEPCKSAYTGIDLDGPRKVLRQLPGVTLKEMKHHGSDTACCGSGAVCWFPESFSQIRKSRLEEAAQTGVESVVTVCHYCSQAFAAEEGHYDFSVTNYVNLVAEAMGIHRDDKFKMYALWRDLNRILKDADEHILESPFEKERIIEVLQTVFIQ
ncbi:MAG: (Fe-S)-binding protein [Deltaproteobacteria bacterium]|nr:(Fe-S)-binding protein [Deltaproteobacteria bacterium]